MSKDDRTIEHVDQAMAKGTCISEFPTTMAAARRARARGLLIMAGAPNCLRDGSQSGHIAMAASWQKGSWTFRHRMTFHAHR
ncbi:hypothetical protein V8J82_13315 [Gymnodinialimonas sp. 2305UL16-5]